MRALRNEFMELDGHRVKIVRNLKVNVLEHSQELLANFVSKLSPKPTNSPENNLTDDKEYNIKPVRVDIGALEKKVTEVGVFYGYCQLLSGHTRRCEEIIIESETHESAQPSDDVMGPGYEDDIENIAIEETESEFVINIDDSSDSETVSGSVEIQKLSDEGFVNKSNESVYFKKKTELVDSDDVVQLKKYLKESEEKLKNRKIKITSLKMSLANIEMKNAEKKLYIQKRDMKIRELEEMIKIQENKLRLKNVSIFRLQKENNFLRKFKASLKPVGKVPGIIQGIFDDCDAKNTKASGEMANVSRNICEEVEMKENIPDDLGEIKPFYEFLSVVAQVKKGSEDEGNSRQDLSDASKNECIDIVEIVHDDIIEVNEKAPDNTITTISSEDEIHLVNEEDDDNILIPTLENYPVPTSMADIVDPFLRLQPFASLCAKSSNIVGRESKKRKHLPSTAFHEALAFLRKPKQARLSRVFHQSPEG